MHKQTVKTAQRRQKVLLLNDNSEA